MFGTYASHVWFYQVALIMFCSLTETIGDFLKPHFATLQAIFIKGLQDLQSSKVRMAALKYVYTITMGVSYVHSSTYN
jgi:hypothetical protein